MNKALTIALAVFGLIGVSLAQAAPIVTISPTGGLPNGAGPGGTDLHIFNINPNGTVFDTIDFNFTAGIGTLLGENVPAIVEFSPAGTVANTDVLGLNTVALGWSILVSSDTPTEFAAAGGPLGLDITDPVDFVQLVATEPMNGFWQIRFADNGVLVNSQGGILWPEPSCAVLALVGLCCLGRRRW